MAADRILVLEEGEDTIEAAFSGSGARDAFELVTRAVTGEGSRWTRRMSAAAAAVYDVAAVS